MDENELAQYYTIKFEKFMEMIKQIDGLYNVLSALIKEHVTANEINEWENTPIPELSGYFAAVNEIKNYLDDIINNPTEEEVELMIKHEIKDVIVSLSDLNALNIMFGAIQEFSDRLYEKHKIATNIQ
jgi:hypothetical protein